MSESSSPELILARAREQETGHEWLGAAESYWRVAQAHDDLGDHRTAAEEFSLASHNFRSAAEKIPSLKEMSNEHATYMDAWRDIENARHHHEKQDYDLAKQFYHEAATRHKSTRQWNFLASNYSAWAAVENAEDLSRKGESEQAIQSFEDGARLFRAGKRSITEELSTIGNSDERLMATNLVKIADLREEYCRARIILEEAKTLDLKGDHNSSAEKYGLAVEFFEKIAQRLGADPAEKEFKLIITLSRAWRAMTQAEAEVSPVLYLEASKLFEEAEQLSPTEKSEMLALGHSRFCKALEAGARFTDTREPNLHDNGVKNLETAADFYLKAGFQSASNYSRACKLLFDAYLYMDEAQKERYYLTKTQLYAKSEKVLEASAESFSKAQHQGRRKQVLDLLKKVREDRNIVVPLSEVFLAPPIISATMSFSAPTPTSERPVGLERFQHANIQASVTANEKSLKVGEDLGLKLEVVNAGRSPAQLVKIEEIIPEGFELRDNPDPYGIERGDLNTKGKQLEPLNTETIRLVIRPSVQGQFRLKPRILYIDESGRYKSHQIEPVEVEVQGLPTSGRRLAAIMFTDMVEFTTMSEKNEALALTLLEDHRQLLRPIFARHGGREVKTIGDGFLVEFPSALEAVRCALEIQQLMYRRNQSVSSERRILLRVAVHLGDVEHRDGDVYGDAVNIASRIQSLTDPGGICITQQVFDHIRNNEEFRMVALGQNQLKNVQTPTEVYRVLPPMETTKLTKSDALEPRRVAALPLSILSSDQQDEYIADGLTEEIINTLSSIPGLRVIARTSVMKYKQVNRSVGEIGRELKVGTILEGSVRKAGSRLRITLQLIDVGSEAPIWAQKYDRELEDVFKIQTDIAERVAEALKIQLLRENRILIEQKAPEDIGAYILYLRGRYYWSKRTREDLEKAIAYFGEAIQKDPNYALAHAGMADCYTLMGRHLYLPAKEAFTKARDHANRALELNENLAEAHTSLAAVLMVYDWDWDPAEEQFKQAIHLNPNYASAHYWHSVLLQTLGRLQESVAAAEKAQVLDPLSPVIGMGVVQAYFFSEQYDKAIEECQKYLEMNPNFVVAQDYLVHLHVRNGLFEKAAEEARRLVDISERKAEAKAHLAYVYAESGKSEEAKKLLEASMADSRVGYSNPTIFITVYSILGDQDSAFLWAEKALESGKIAFPNLRLSPDLKRFRADSRYNPFLEKAHLQ